MSTLSRASLQAISKQFINQELAEQTVLTLAQDVRDSFSKLIADAMKHARRTRSSVIKMEHLLVAMQDNDLCLDILHVDYDWEDDEEVNEINSYIRESREKIPKAVAATVIKGRPDSPDEKQFAAPKGSAKQWVKREQVLLMANKKFPLSKEQQNFFLLITESCMGSSEAVRRDALRRLSTDSSLQPMLAKLSLFILESVQVNVAQHNFALLLYLMRMVQGLLNNGNLRLHNYIHLLIPAVMSCTVTRQLCSFPAAQNHWALREYASNLITEFVKKFNSNDNSILPRIISMYKSGLESSSLTTIYGSLIGLAKMGKYAIRECVLPQLRVISARIEPFITRDDADNLNKQAAICIRHRLLKMMTPILRSIHQPPDAHEEYARLYGFLGPSLCDVVVIDRIIANVFEEVDDQKFSIELTDKNVLS
ncbi:hypothetical protein KR222_007959 [Zaprionus bogoriensis]|nr:hypothetical protein KR222_007959 [Zaprionus bogoriensis]